MDQVKVRFLETRVVEDQYAGTARETRFEAGKVYELDARSADRWAKRGAARYVSEDDARRALGASGDVSLQVFDADRDDGQRFGNALRYGGNPGDVTSSEQGPTTADGDDAERLVVAERLAVLATRSLHGLSLDAWNALSNEEQVAAMRDAEAVGIANDPFDHDGDGRPGGSLPRERDADGVIGNTTDTVVAGADKVLPGTEENIRLETTADSALPDTDGDRQGDAAPATGPIGDTPVGARFDAMTDDELRNYLEDRDGRRPGPRTSRETLLAKANDGGSTDQAE